MSRMEIDIATQVRSVDKRAFLATRQGEELLVHTVMAGVEAKPGLRVEWHDPSALHKARTLQDLSAAFGNGAIAYDPTHIFKRLRGIVRLAAELRRAIGKDISQIAFEPRVRKLYLVLNETRAMDDNAVGRLLLQVATVARNWQADGIDCHISIKLCRRLPPAALLVPVDRRSIRASAFAGLFSGWRSALAALGLSAAAATPVAAQAVDGANFTSSVLVNSEGKTDFVAKVTPPVVDNLGAQLDLGLGTDGYRGAGGQLFLRDPELGLLGLAASAEELNDNTLYRLGAKTEFYLQSLTLGANSGIQSREGDSAAFGGVDVSLYAAPDFAIRGQADFTPDLELYRVGVEWRPGFDALPGLSVFSDFEYGSDDESSARVGLVYHFGDDAGTPLMQRDRTQSTGSTIFNRQVLNYVS